MYTETTATIEKFEQMLLNQFNSNDAFIKCKNKELFIILVNGKRVIMRSGKMIWAGKGAAKSALRQHMTILSAKVRFLNKEIYANKDITYSKLGQCIKKIQNEWIKKHVVIMPFLFWINMQKNLTK